MEELLKYLGDSLYTPLITFLLSLAGAVISVNYSKGILKIFTAYFIGFAFLQGFYFLFLIINRGWNHSPLIDLSFTVFEFLIFTRIFWEIFPTQIRRILILLSLIFLSFTFYYTLIDLKRLGVLKLLTLEKIFIIESISLLIPCIIYYVRVFNLKEPLPLLNDKFFWITTGLSFFILSTLPFSYLMNYLRVEKFIVYKYLYSIVYLFYCLLFLMIIRAIVCKPVLVK